MKSGRRILCIKMYQFYSASCVSQSMNLTVPRKKYGSYGESVINGDDTNSNRGTF